MENILLKKKYPSSEGSCLQKNTKLYHNWQGEQTTKTSLILHENQYISGTDYLQTGNLIEEFWYGDISLTLKLQY